MAKLKKSSTKGGARKTTANASGAQAERLGKSITESAQQIWLAGMGAFNRAQSEGGKLFESLVRDGLSLEQTARKFTGARADMVRDAVSQGQIVLVAETRTAQETAIAREVIGASVGDVRDVVAA